MESILLEWMKNKGQWSVEAAKRKEWVCLKEKKTNYSSGLLAPTPCGMNWIAFLSLWVNGGSAAMLRKERENKSNSMNGAQRPQAQLLSLLFFSLLLEMKDKQAINQSKKLIEWLIGFAFFLWEKRAVGYELRSSPAGPFHSSKLHLLSFQLPWAIKLNWREEEKWS